MALSRTITQYAQYGSSSKSVSYALTGDTEVEISEVVTNGGSVVLPASITAANVKGWYVSSSNDDTVVQTSAAEVMLPAGKQFASWATGSGDTNPVTTDATSLTLDNTAGSVDATVTVFILLDTP